MKTYNQLVKAKQGHVRPAIRRKTAARRGYGSKWQRARALYLARHPLCVTCLGVNRVATATVVDHIVPHRGVQTLFWDQDNWQALCRLCHNRKTAGGE